MSKFENVIHKRNEPVVVLYQSVLHYNTVLWSHCENPLRATSQIKFVSNILLLIMQVASQAGYSSIVMRSVHTVLCKTSKGSYFHNMTCMPCMIFPI